MAIGTVKQIEKDYTIVTIERQDMCGDCHACEVVGEVKKCEIRCSCDCEVALEDKVEVDLTAPRFLKATLYMYGLPLASLLLGLFLGSLIPDTVGLYMKEVAMVVTSLGLMGLSLLWIKKQDNSKKYKGLLPQIKGKLNQ